MRGIEEGSRQQDHSSTLPVPVVGTPNRLDTVQR